MHSFGSYRWEEISQVDINYYFFAHMILGIGDDGSLFPETMTRHVEGCIFQDLKVYLFLDVFQTI